MNQEVKVRWVAALRSGRYKQGDGVLRSRDDKFCCLGVLCELAVNDGVIDPPEIYDDDSQYVYGVDNMLLSPKVWDWAGLDGANPGAGFYGDLSNLNDTGSTFAEIADVIEAEL